MAMSVIAQKKAKHDNIWVRVRRVREDHFVVEFLSPAGWAEVPMLASTTRQRAVQQMRRLADNILPDSTDPSDPTIGGWVAARLPVQ
jgi:hypothetical protein